ncbi:MAG: amino acid ABC transporter permease [Firmicutes bacterium]|jgi:polar amino acid transport system permease protein|nr:amino acid ABC transporter permease [Bacillota bacterium]
MPSGLVGKGFFEITKLTAPLFLKGAQMTLSLTCISIVLGICIGLSIALLKMSKKSTLRNVGSIYTWFFRGTPLLVQIWLVYFGLGQFGINLSGFISGSIALSLNSGAYMAEIIRAAIESIPKGQMEAAKSLGMTYSLAMRRVILPQSVRRMVPPMVNEFVSLLKDSSLIATIGIVELLLTARLLTSSTFMPFTFYFLVAVFYLALTTIFTTLGSTIERWMASLE